jgi:hypothetical protein
VKVYQLAAVGEMACFERQHTIRSRKVFVSREAALAYEPEFRSLCLGGDELSRLVAIEKIRVHELEVIE